MIDKENWEEAKKINQTDGNEPSTYLEDLIKENIDKEITNEEIIKTLKEHYTNEE